MGNPAQQQVIEYAIPATVGAPGPAPKPHGRFTGWLLQHRVQPVGPEADESHAKPQSWWKVMCL
ncbi:hypothetical protein AB0B66_43605, partial [Catellatospora sp. NPDC049111]